MGMEGQPVMYFVGVVILMLCLTTYADTGAPTEEDIRNTRCQLGEKVCVDGTCCDLLTEVCSDKSRTCEPLFEKGQDIQQTCCEVLRTNRSSTAIDGQLDACLRRYGQENWQKHTCSSPEEQEDQTKYYVMTGAGGVLAGAVLMFLIMCFCLPRQTCRRKQISGAKIYFTGEPRIMDDDVNKEDEILMNRESNRLLLQSGDDNERAPDNAPVNTAADRAQSNISTPRANGTTQQNGGQSQEKQSMVQPSHEVPRVHSTMVSRESVPASPTPDHVTDINPGQLSSQKNRAMHLDQTTAHGEQSEYVPSGRGYKQDFVSINV